MKAFILALLAVIGIAFAAERLLDTYLAPDAATRTKNNAVRL